MAAGKAGRANPLPAAVCQPEQPIYPDCCPRRRFIGLRRRARSEESGQKRLLIRKENCLNRITARTCSRSRSFGLGGILLANLRFSPDS
jgi:hypothetical protein